MYAENAASARYNMIAQTDDINLRLFEEQEAASQALFDSRQDALRRRGMAAVQAGESGVTGNSIVQLLRSISGESLRDQNRTYRSFTNTSRQLTRSLDGVHANAQTNINSVGRGQRPSPFGLAAGIASAALTGYNTHRRIAGP